MARRLAHLSVLISLVFLLTLCVGASALAQGGLALSGNFYRQEFNLPQGASLSSPDIYVVVFNNSNGPFTVRMQTVTPGGVQLALSETEFVLNAGEQKRIVVGVVVGQEAVPGDYGISVIAECQKSSTGGIQLLGAAAQEASLTVTGDAATVQIACVSPSGDAVPAVVKLLRKAADQSFEQGQSDTGSLDVRVAPGDYVASAHIGGKVLAEESFSIGTDESKEIRLTLKTVYVEGFGALPSYNSQTGQLAFAQVVYTINNLHQAFPDVKAILQVQRDGQPLDEITVATMAPLEKGRMGSSYPYIPSDGWVAATYAFRLVLQIEGEPYTASAPAELVVGPDVVPGGGKPTNWLLIGGIAVAAVAVAAAAIFLLSKRRPRPETSG